MTVILADFRHRHEAAGHAMDEVFGTDRVTATVLSARITVDRGVRLTAYVHPVPTGECHG